MIGLHPGAGEIVHAVAGLGPDAPSTIVRIPATGACANESAGWQIKYALDAGARGIVVPMVSPPFLPNGVALEAMRTRIPVRAFLAGTGEQALQPLVWS